MPGLADKGKFGGPGGEDPNRKHARAAQTSFDSYAPVLIFGILGLAVQSVIWRHNCSDYLNIASFFLLLLAGIIALWRLERLPKYYVAAARVNEQTEIRDVLLTRPGPPPDQATVDLASRLLESASLEESDEQTWAMKLYQVQRLAFVLGLVILLVARILPAFCAAPVFR